MAFQSILLPHDGSELSGAIVDAIAPLVGDSSRVTLLHVDDGGPVEGARLERAEKALRERGAEVTRREVESKDPAGAIVDVAKELSPDLIAMTTHGRSGVERWVRGSVAERVLRACPVPVLMINPHVQSGVDLGDVLVPLDSSPTSARILEPLIPIGRALDSHLTLLYVDWDDPTDTPERAAQRRAARVPDVEEWLAEPRARLEKAGVRFDLAIAQGDVAREIVTRSESGEHGLLAMTTHGRSGPSRWMLGSIAEKVLRNCRIPILLMRGSDGD